MRLTLASAAACEKLANERCTPGRAVDVTDSAVRSPYIDASTDAAAALTVAWAPGYDGSGAVVDSGVHAGSAAVAGLPSASAARIAVTGRHRRYVYLAS